MQTIPIPFESDGLHLSGVLHLPPGTDMPLVVGSHGLMGSSASAKQLVLAGACAESGIAFFRFDHRGCGHSDGDVYRDTSLEARCRDLVDAVAAVRDRAPVGKALGLFGSSFGGAVSLNSAARVGAAAVICCAALVRTRDIHVPRDDMHRGVEGAIPPFDISGDIGDVHDVLLFHGDADEVVPVEHARIIHDAVRPPREMVIQAGGDHRMTDPVHQSEFRTRSMKWLVSRLR